MTMKRIRTDTNWGAAEMTEIGRRKQRKETRQ